MTLFQITPEIFDKFPEVIIGVVVARDCDNKGYSDEIRKLLAIAANSVKETFSLENLSQHPLIKNWRDAYKKFGEKKDRASHESLIRRVLKGNEIPKISKLVDLYNYISLKYKVPVGGDDLDKIKGNIILTFANGNERFIELGSGKESKPEKGEVIYRDEEKVICRKWNWRESDETKITEETKNAIFVIEGLPPINARVVEAACKELCSLLEKFCSARTKYFLLNKENPGGVME